MGYVFPKGYSDMPLLTAEKEIELARTIREGNEAQARIDESTSLPATEKRALWRAAQKSKHAREHFIKANIRLVLKLAGQYTGRGMAYPDLVQEGTIGLMHAITKFDPERGYRFSTYATPWIRQAMGRAISNQSNTIRVPEHQLVKANKIAAAYTALTNLNNEDPTIAQIAEHTGFTIRQVEEISAYNRAPISLATPLGSEGENLTVGDMIVDEVTANPEMEAETSNLKSTLSRVIEKLNEKEAKVLMLRFGLADDAVPHTLDEIASTMGTSKEWARRVELKAMTKLRHPRYVNLLKDFVQV